MVLKSLAVTNDLAYYKMSLLTAVKSFIGLACHLESRVERQVFEGGLLEGGKENFGVGVSLEKLQKRFDANLEEKKERIQVNRVCA